MTIEELAKFFDSRNFLIEVVENGISIESPNGRSTVVSLGLLELSKDEFHEVALQVGLLL